MHNIPTAYQSFTAESLEAGKHFRSHSKAPYVIKAIELLAEKSLF
jgi:phosphoribosylamine--glycine ligase